MARRFHLPRVPAIPWLSGASRRASMKSRCSVWKESDHHVSSGAYVSRCSGGVQLQVRPESLAHTSSRDPWAYVVRRNGTPVRWGVAKGRDAAKRAARRQAGLFGARRRR
jgi:hypothetical protein